MKAIMRCAKLTHMGNVASSLQHCFRERETLNANSTRTHLNVHNAANSVEGAMGRLRALLPEKRRKDAVLAVEYVMSASPEWWMSASQDQQKDFFTQAWHWIAEKYGADRVIVSTEHHDEKTPHLSVFVVPLTKDGRLSAKEFVGNRQKLAADQTSFAKKVAHLGLERGVEGSKATHTTISAYYQTLSRAVPRNRVVEPFKPSVSDRLNVEAYGKKIAQKAADFYQPLVRFNGALEDELQRLKKRIASLEKSSSQSRFKEQSEQIEMLENELISSLGRIAKIEGETEKKDLRIELLQQRLRESEEHRIELAEQNNELIVRLRGHEL